MASDRAEVDTARPFLSVKEAVAVFGERILSGDCTLARSNAKIEATTPKNPTPVMAMVPTTTMPMYSASSSPPSYSSSPSQFKEDKEVEEAQQLMILNTIRKMEADVADVKQELAQLKKRESEMESVVASINAQLHKCLSKLAEMEAQKVAVDGEMVEDSRDIPTIVRSDQWGDRGAVDNEIGVVEFEYLPTLAQAFSLGEIDHEELASTCGSRRSGKMQKKKPIVPLICNIFSKKKREDDFDAFILRSFSEW